ncbi:hypothetical protein [Flavobacterium sp.]|jgi:hypothetical protein|uniref:hypothetical protein n=1 Tax=Flavobacterium sp. TaxID=239 RepID=UPI0037BF306D
MANLNIPNNFSAGTPAVANSVNANFSAVKSFVETELVQRDGSVKATAASYGEGSIQNVALAEGTITNDKLNYSSIPRTTVSTSDPTGGKNGDVWVKVIVP